MSDFRDFNSSAIPFKSLNFLSISTKFFESLRLAEKRTYFNLDKRYGLWHFWLRFLCEFFQINFEKEHLEGLGYVFYLPDTLLTANFSMPNPVG